MEEPPNLWRKLYDKSPPPGDIRVPNLFWKPSEECPKLLVDQWNENVREFYGYDPESPDHRNQLLNAMVKAIHIHQGTYNTYNPFIEMI